MNKTEKTNKFKTFLRTFKAQVKKNQPKMCREFETMLVAKLDPNMEQPWDLSGRAERTFTKFLVGLGYDKELGTLWEESGTLMDYYSTWFDEVWYAFQEHNYLSSYTPWSQVEARIVRHLGL